MTTHRSEEISAHQGITGGAFCRFAPGAAHKLAELLRAAAAYAAGGLKALADLKGQSAGVARLIEQLK